MIFKQCFTHVKEKKYLKYVTIKYEYFARLVFLKIYDAWNLPFNDGQSFLWTENQPIRSRFVYFLCICFSPEKWPLNARFGSTFVYWLIYFGISRISFLAQAAGSDSCCLWIRFWICLPSAKINCVNGKAWGRKFHPPEDRPIIGRFEHVRAQIGDIES